MGNGRVYVDQSQFHNNNAIYNMSNVPFKLCEK